LAHPGHALEGLSRAGEVDGEKVARQPRRDIGAQGRRAVVGDVALHRDAADGKDRVAQGPPRERCQQQDGASRQQRRSGDVHQLDVERCGNCGAAHFVAASFS
jgi:hypothetical protein